MSMQGVNGQWHGELTVGGVSIPLNPTTVPRLDWFQTIHQNLPSLNLEINDDTGAVLSIAQDGVPITITLGDGKSGESSSRFNVQGAPQISTGGSYYRIQLNAVLDAMPYMRGIASGLYEGPSTNALSKVAQQAGLSFNGHTTGDAQVWLPNNQTLAGFARHIASHGWSSDTSAMLLGVTDKFELLYKDADRLIQGGASSFFGLDGMPIIDYSATSKGLLSNNNRALGVTSSGFDIEGKLKELANISVTQLSNSFSFSQTNKASIGTLGGRLDQIVRDAGNTHKKFAEAVHQNKRIKSMYSFDLNILTDVSSGVELLTKVYAAPADVLNPGANSLLSGEYIVTAITKSLTGPRYAERLTLTSTGPN